MATTTGRRALPILGGILPIDPSRIGPDVVAGMTLAALAIPEVMGYTKIAGTPVITGLYTILLPIIAFAILGSSRHLVVGADSATAAILATGLVAMGAAGGSAEYVELASLAALMCAALLVLARALRLGFIANFLSRSVLIGFLTGVGIQVVMGQVGGMLGITGEPGGTIRKFLETVRDIPSEASLPTLAVSAFVLVTIVGLGRVNKRIPGALLAVVVTIVASAILDFEAYGIKVLGAVPGGLPTVGLPTSVMTLANVAALAPMTISLVVVILAQSAATSRAYAMKYADSFNENVDLVGLGAANLAAAVTGTFVVNGSPTKTEMVDSAGGRTQVAQLAAAAVVVAVLLFLTGPLAYMPEAVLATVVFIIGVRLIDLDGMVDIYRLRKGEFAVAAITAATVVVVGVEQGIVLAMALSIIEHIRHSYRPYDTLVVGSVEDGFRTVPLEDGGQAAPGVAVYRFGSGLYYANATRFTEEIVGVVERAQPPLHTLVILGSALADVDYSGSDTLREVLAELDRRGVTLAFADLSPAVRRELDAYGLTERIGPERIFGSLRDAVAASASPSPAPSPAPATPPAPAQPPESAPPQGS